MRKTVKEESDNRGEIDRLSELPIEILQHILDYLETKDVVQTSVLAKRWRNSWTCVDALNFDSNSFTKLNAFKRFVRNVLRMLDGNSRVGTVRFVYNLGYDRKFMRSVIDYAIARNVNHLKVWASPRPGAWNCRPESLPSKLFEYQNLETLQLKFFKFNQPLISFIKLTSLRLENCSFHGIDMSSISSCCPNLNQLCLSSCWCDSKLKLAKISGPQLLSLTINDCWWYCKLEISAPKVTFFKCSRAGHLNFSVINLPSLQHADLDFTLPDNYLNTVEDRRKVLNACADLQNLLVGISNVQCLTLSSPTIKALAELLELEPVYNPFSRLKCWKLRQKCSFQIPAEVSAYLGSPRPCNEINHQFCHHGSPTT